LILSKENDMRVSSNAPALSRRNMMRGLTAGLIGASVPVAAIAGLTELPENPALLALAGELETAVTNHAKAVAERDRACAVGKELWPRAPAEAYGWSGKPDQIERDCAGYGYPGIIYILTAKDIRQEKPSRGKGAIAEWRRHLEVVKKYERARKLAHDVSGYPAANDALKVARNNLERIIAAIITEPAVTMQGVVIKARALQAWTEVETFWRITNMQALNWGPGLADALLGVLGDSSAPQSAEA
jgi:hypothetical protein